MKPSYGSLVALFVVTTVLNATVPSNAPRWEWIDISFQIEHASKNPYLEVQGEVEFTHESGLEIDRPIFWDGGDTFRVRFASPYSKGAWDWKLKLSKEFTAYGAISGRLGSTPSVNSNQFTKHGFWTIPDKQRSIVHHDGSSVLMVADTAWALPWRATSTQVKKYASDRKEKGFNAALLMSIMPDQKAVGPDDRTKDEGFGVAFYDLPNGELKNINVNYFRYLDGLIEILRSNEIVPVIQPVFHGYGWKGLETAGSVVSKEDYARYCKYLVARYGAGPCMWLVGADCIGNEATISAGGKTIEDLDEYKHPLGIHYAPHGQTDSHQGDSWLEFQWAQTGHNAEHIPEATTNLYYQRPTKACANGEPTYENMGSPGNASGWWQGHEAWSNLCAGGTMGVVYGAGSLWNWVLRPDEPGHQPWTVAKGCSWENALDFEGSIYVGIVGKILNQFKLTGLEPSLKIAPARRSLHIPGELVVIYRGNGGNLWFPNSEALPNNYRIYDAETAEILAEGTMNDPAVNALDVLNQYYQGPSVSIFYVEERLK